MKQASLKPIEDSKVNFSQNAIQNISGFSDTLKRVHIRLISEGHTIRDGLIIRPTSSLLGVIR